MQISTESHESCLSTQSTWLLTRKGMFLHQHLSPSAPTRGTAACLDRKDRSWKTWQSVTSSDQSSLKVSSATHLTLQSWVRKGQNQANQMDFSFCWTPTLINWTLPVQENNLSRSSSTHLHSTLHLDLDLMGWALWKEWQEQKASSNFLTTRRSALFTTERNARRKSTWIKFRGNAFVPHGPYKLSMIRASIRCSLPVAQRRSVVFKSKR